MIDPDEKVTLPEVPQFSPTSRQEITEQIQIDLNDSDEPIPTQVMDATIDILQSWLDQRDPLHRLCVSNLSAQNS